MGEKETINVYLDDHRPCPAGFVLAKNVEECLALLEHYEIDTLSLDHDLGWNEPSGTYLAEVMVERGLYARDIYLHSSSAHGRMRMFQLLFQNKPEHVRIHMVPMPDELIERIALRSARGGVDR